MTSIVNTSFKLVSEYDNTGIRAAMKDQDEFSRKMIAGMTESGQSTKTDPMMAKLSTWNEAQTKAAEAAANQAAADREVWAARARLRDEDVQKEIASTQARTKTESILSQARRLSIDTEMRALAQKQIRAQSDAQVLMAIDKNRHDQAMAFIFQEGDAAEGRMGGGKGGAKGGVGGGISAGFARNLQQVGFATQDFVSQWNNAKTAAEGFGRGVSALANNIQVMGAGLPPMQQAMFAIGGAAAGIIVPAVAKWLDDSHKIEEQTRAIEKSYASLKSMVEGLKDVGQFGAGLSNGEDAQKRLDTLRDQRSTLARQSDLVRNKIGEEMAGGNDQAKIDALRKHNTEIAGEYEKLDIQIQTIEQHWTATRLKESKDRREQLKKDKEAEKTIEEDNDKSMVELRKQFADEIRAEDEKIRRQYDKRQADLRSTIEDIRDKEGGLNPNGQSAAGVRGTGAAVSAISRAIGGTRSEESDRKQQIKVLEDQLKVLNRLEQKMNFQRAGLNA